MATGITDAATKVEIVSSLDLRTGHADAQLKLGLRRRCGVKSGLLELGVAWGGSACNLGDEPTEGPACSLLIRQAAGAAHVLPQCSHMQPPLSLRRMALAMNVTSTITTGGASLG